MEINLEKLKKLLENYREALHWAEGQEHIKFISEKMEFIGNLMAVIEELEDEELE